MGGFSLATMLSAQVLAVFCVMLFKGILTCPPHERSLLRKCSAPLKPLINRNDLPSHHTCTVVQNFINCVEARLLYCRDFIEKNSVLETAGQLKTQYCVASARTPPRLLTTTTELPTLAEQEFELCRYAYNRHNPTTLLEGCMLATTFLDCSERVLYHHGFAVDTFHLHAELLRNLAFYWKHCSGGALYGYGMGQGHCSWNTPSRLQTCLRSTRSIKQGDAYSICSVAQDFIPCLQDLADGCYRVRPLRPMADFLWKTFDLLASICKQPTGLDKDYYNYYDYDNAMNPEKNEVPKTSATPRLEPPTYKSKPHHTYTEYKEKTPKPFYPKHPVTSPTDSTRMESIITNKIDSPLEESFTKDKHSKGAGKFEKEKYTRKTSEEESYLLPTSRGPLLSQDKYVRKTSQEEKHASPSSQEKYARLTTEDDKYLLPAARSKDGFKDGGGKTDFEPKSEKEISELKHSIKTTPGLTHKKVFDKEADLAKYGLEQRGQTEQDQVDDTGRNPHSEKLPMEYAGESSSGYTKSGARRGSETSGSKDDFLQGKTGSQESGSEEIGKEDAGSSVSGGERTDCGETRKAKQGNDTKDDKLQRKTVQTTKEEDERQGRPGPRQKGQNKDKEPAFSPAGRTAEGRRQGEKQKVNPFSPRGPATQLRGGTSRATWVKSTGKTTGGSKPGVQPVETDGTKGPLQTGTGTKAGHDNSENPSQEKLCSQDRNEGENPDGRVQNEHEDSEVIKSSSASSESKDVAKQELQEQTSSKTAPKTKNTDDRNGKNREQAVKHATAEAKELDKAGKLRTASAEDKHKATSDCQSSADDTSTSEDPEDHITEREDLPDAEEDSKHQSKPATAIKSEDEFLQGKQSRGKADSQFESAQSESAAAVENMNDPLTHEDASAGRETENDLPATQAGHFQFRLYSQPQEEDSGDFQERGEPSDEDINTNADNEASYQSSKLSPNADNIYGKNGQQSPKIESGMATDDNHDNPVTMDMSELLASQEDVTSYNEASFTSKAALNEEYGTETGEDRHETGRNADVNKNMLTTSQWEDGSDQIAEPDVRSSEENEEETSLGGRGNLDNAHKESLDVKHFEKDHHHQKNKEAFDEDKTQHTEHSSGQNLFDTSGSEFSGLSSPEKSFTSNSDPFTPLKNSHAPAATLPEEGDAPDKLEAKGEKRGSQKYEDYLDQHPPWGRNCSRPWDGQRWCTNIMMSARLGNNRAECKSLSAYIICLSDLITACNGFAPFASIADTLDFVSSTYKTKCLEAA